MNFIQPTRNSFQYVCEILASCLPSIQEWVDRWQNAVIYYIYKGDK